jgi:hypothetical protein
LKYVKEHKKNYREIKLLICSEFQYVVERRFFSPEMMKKLWYLFPISFFSSKKYIQSIFNGFIKNKLMEENEKE